MNLMPTFFPTRLLHFIALLNKKMTGVRYSQLIDAVYPGGFMQFERDFTDFCNSD